MEVTNRINQRVKTSIRVVMLVMMTTILPSAKQPKGMGWE
jgi:hypothetical protein